MIDVLKCLPVSLAFDVYCVFKVIKPGNCKGNLCSKIAFWHQLVNRMKVRNQIDAINKNNTLEDIADPIFITGLPRSGTTFLFDLLNG